MRMSSEKGCGWNKDIKQIGLSELLFYCRTIFKVWTRLIADNKRLHYDISSTAIEKNGYIYPLTIRIKKV
jgi:hypothetical protein